ncbi:energy transducer TonB [Niveibacterium terrae]|uniref:energy transducer TonB n=1 Tax=Niveibacterium terrae TaxID=3373598 RepID=UPI003A904297
MSAAVNLVYRYRDWVSVPPAALLLVLLLGATAQTVVKKLASSHPEIKVELSEPAPLPEKAPEPPRAQPQAAPQAQPQARPVAAQPAQTPTHSPEASAQPSPAAAPTAAPAAPAPAAPAAHPAPVAPAAAPAPRAEHESVQNAFTAKIRADVLARKSYPRGREASLEKPRGTVRAWLELDRSGAVRDVGIETGSGSMILDGAARKLLRGGNYPAFPEAAFPGEGSHRFYFDLDYQPGAAS